MSGKLYKGLESLDVLESLDDDEFDFVYLEVPYYTMNKFYSDVNIRNRIASTHTNPIVKVSREQVEEERKKEERESLSKYNDYIKKVIENSYRILKKEGILAFLCPSHAYVDINYQLIIEQYFSAYSDVTLETRKNPINSSQGNNNSLYFYSKIPDYNFPILKEMGPIEKYHEKDEYDYYIKQNVMGPKHGIHSLEYEYEWHGITPSGNFSWRYSKEKMDSLYAEGRIIIAQNRVYLKRYRSEHLVPVSSVWKVNNNTQLDSKFPSLIDSQSIERMFSMFVKEDSRVLCPFEREGKFSFIADNHGITWEAVYTPIHERPDLFKEIPSEHYEIINEIQAKTPRVYRNDIVTNINDINKLKMRLMQLSSDIKRIQSEIGVDDDSKCEQMHKAINKAVSPFSLGSCVIEAQKWIDPFWDKLEPESQHFIPTGMLIYNHLSDEQHIDMAPIMIEYCKSLEKELFMKMFYGYIKDLIEKEINVKEAFPEAFEENTDTKVFAEFLNDCTTKYKDNPKEWKFEMGKMKYVLQNTLCRRPKDNLFISFRYYLDQIFEKKFFRERFIERLDVIKKMRNDCAHPYFIKKTDVEEVKELIRKKLLVLLKNYPDEND